MIGCTWVAIIVAVIVALAAVLCTLLVITYLDSRRDEPPE